EEAISSHPAIVEAAIVGTPHARFGEQVTAFVVVRDGMKWPGRDAIIGHLQEVQLARQKFPVAWRVLDELPKTLSGKVQKHLLMKLWQDALTDTAEPG
ncbi:MAG: AMP-binding enzyme, partial [Ktedonobacterales bacterium]